MQVGQVMRSAGAFNKVPIFCLYNTPFRDCAQSFAGGATSAEQYLAWVDGVHAGIGSGEAIVILEPDSLSIIPWATTIDGDPDWFQPAEANNATAEAERYDMTIEAVTKLKSNPNTNVYLESSHNN